MSNTIHNEIQVHTSLCQQTNMSMAEDVGAELLVDVSVGTKSSDGLVEHFDGRRDAFLVTEYKVRFIYRKYYCDHLIGKIGIVSEVNKNTVVVQFAEETVLCDVSELEWIT